MADRTPNKPSGSKTVKAQAAPKQPQKNKDGGTISVDVNFFKRIETLMRNSVREGFFTEFDR